ncbi:hypothetical protein LPJ53_003840, partial [Coemansia erecta]
PSPALSTAKMDKDEAGATDARPSARLSRHGRELDGQAPRIGFDWRARLESIEAFISTSGRHGEAARAAYSY